MKTQLFLLFTLSAMTSFAQSPNTELNKINTRDQALAFIKTSPKLNGEVIEIDSEMAKKLFVDGIDKPAYKEEYAYKVFESKKSFLINAFYIYLDGSKLSIPQIDSVRQLIISKYGQGVPFADLAKEFNMDGNPDPNMKMIAEGMLVKGFSDAVKGHKKGEVFKIDLPDKKWYYVTQKTDNEQESISYSVLKIKSNN